ncbi:hypothetical protein [Radicibacter daui]|uniref:hypothetical protein n=1 Tax=Radicibacter daui TaxID=3064829 RepID=UPI004046C40D
MRRAALLLIAVAAVAVAGCGVKPPLSKLDPDKAQHRPYPARQEGEQPASSPAPDASGTPAS